MVNAAGITHYSLLVTSKPEMLEQIVQTNLMGTIWSCQLLAKKMMRRRQGTRNRSPGLVGILTWIGCIINVSSLLGAKGGKGSTVYAASKAGIIGTAMLKGLIFLTDNWL